MAGVDVKEGLVVLQWPKITPETRCEVDFLAHGQVRAVHRHWCGARQHARRLVRLDGLGLFDIEVRVRVPSGQLLALKVGVDGADLRAGRRWHDEITEDPDDFAIIGRGQGGGHWQHGAVLPRGARVVEMSATPLLALAAEALEGGARAARPGMESWAHSDMLSLSIERGATAVAGA